jgi:hypothetical protein
MVSGAHSAWLSVGTGGAFSGGKAAGRETVHLHLVPRYWNDWGLLLRPLYVFIYFYFLAQVWN